MAMATPVENFAILTRLVAPNDSAMTYNNIASSEGSFRIEKLAL